MSSETEWLDNLISSHKKSNRRKYITKLKRIRRNSSMAKLIIIFSENSPKHSIPNSNPIQSISQNPFEL